MSEDTAVAFPIRFITDQAAEEDAFDGPHRRVAEAILTTVRETEAKTIGLVGPWGSGKSTVVKLVGKALGSEVPLKFHMFTYDAWIHQSDPPRRAFLEQLIGFLKSSGFVSDDQWQDELDKLQKTKDKTDTTTTPVLTMAGRLLLLPIFLLPVAYIFSGRSWYDAHVKVGSAGWDFWAFPIALGVMASPLVLAAGLYGWLRPVRNPIRRLFWKKDNFLKHRAPHQDESILALIANRHIVHQRTESLKGDDPTAIEFQKTFRRMLKTVADKKERLVIVVDNLDRLDREEALLMWTTIRSFFLGAIGDNEGVERSDLPTVILPVDTSAIQRAQNAHVERNANGPADESAKAYANELGRSFMDKSFDVIFHVAPPVLTNWQAFLRTRMEHAFGGGLQEPWIHQTARMIRRKAEESSITPRDVGRAVNGIAAMWVQSRSLGIPFVSIAYYAVFKSEIDDNLTAALASPKVDFTDDDPSWRNSVAALYYCIEPDLATQIFLDGQLRNAVAKKSKAAFQSAANIAGFGTAIEKLLEDREFLTPGQLVNFIALLPLIETEEPWRSFAWKNLGKQFARGNLWEGIGQHSADTVDLLLAHTDTDDLSRLLERLATALARAPDPLFAEEAFIAQASRIIVSAAAKAAEQEMKLPVLRLAAADGGFLELASAVYESKPALDWLLGSRDTRGLAAELVKDLARAASRRHEQKARIVLATKPASWIDLVNAASKAIEVSEAELRPAQSAALGILGGLFPRLKEAEEAVSARADDGSLQEIVNATLLVKEQEEIGIRAMTLMLLADEPVSRPAGQTWSSVLAQIPGLSSKLDVLLQGWRDPGFFELFLTQIHKDESIAPIIEPMMSAAIGRGDIGSLELAEFIANPGNYLDHLNADDEAAFVSLLPDQDEFWEKLATAGAAADALLLTTRLFETHPTAVVRAQARKSLSEKLKALSTQEWTAAVRESDNAIILAAAKLVASSGRKPAIGEPLFSSLTQLMPELIANEDRPYAGNWFESAAFLAASYRRTLLRTLRDRLLSITAPPKLERLLAAGGQLLLAEGEFEVKADESMRHLVLPLIDSGGLEWLLSESDTVETWFRKANADTRTVVREHLAKGELVEGERARAELLLQKLG